MVCNEPLRPGQRLKPDCPGFFIASIANPANVEVAFCSAFSAALQWPQSAFSAVPDPSILSKRDEPLRASYGHLRWFLNFESMGSPLAVMDEKGTDCRT